MKNIMKLFIVLTFILLGTQAVFATPAGDNILITEVEYDVLGTEPNEEWFELYNPTAAPIDINGWTITDGEGTVNFIVSLVINPGEYKVISYDGTAFFGVYGFWADYEYGVGGFGDPSLQLANAGDELSLLDGVTLVDFVSWENHTPGWSVVADAGETIARPTFTDTDLVADWSGHQSPTPGSRFNNVPTAIELNGGSALSIDENTAFGSNIAAMTTTDADSGETYSYDLVSGTGDEDNAQFSVSGSNLQLAFTPDYETPIDLGDTAANNTYAIRLETDDGHGGTFEQAFIITVLDVVDETAPVITLTGSDPVDTYLGEVYSDDGATALDDVDGDITGSIVVVNPVDTSILGSYTVTYNVDDAAGNSAVEVTRTVNVVQKTSKKKSGHKKVSKERLLEIFGTPEKESIDEPKETPIGVACSVNYSRLVRRGLVGEDVRQVQKCMNSLGYESGPEDGIYGPLTYAGITAYQRAMNLRWVDGIFGPETFGALGM